MGKNKKSKKLALKHLKQVRTLHKVIFTLMGVVGVILLWRGVWTLSDLAPIVNHPIVSIIIGLILVFISGAFFKLI